MSVSIQISTFIPATSTGDKDGWQNMAGGLCASKSMRLRITVLQRRQSPPKSSPSRSSEPDVMKLDGSTPSLREDYNVGSGRGELAMRRDEPRKSVFPEEGTWEYYKGGIAAAQPSSSLDSDDMEWEAEQTKLIVSDLPSRRDFASPSSSDRSDHMVYYDPIPSSSSIPTFIPFLLSLSILFLL